tara:strand:+ start:74786 stop:75673 length:888 start_codon:yes stop_codon:yes gene_type:complete
MFVSISKILFVMLLMNTLCFADIRAMTINTEWLWTPFDKKVDGRLKYLRDMSEVDYLAEIAFYKRQIQAKNIDIVSLSEIENEQVANELVRELGADWKVYFKQGRDTATGQDVAIISSLPYVEESLTDFNFPAGFIAGEGKAKKLTKIVGAQFWLKDKKAKGGLKQKLGVITAHLLSKRNENNKKATNREKQALGLKQAIDRFRAETDALLVLGDFNDQLKSSTLSIIIGDHLSTYQHCRNFAKNSNSNESKRWLRHIDHLLYSGLHCIAQYKLDLQKFSDHPAIYGEFTIHPSK